MRLQSPFRFLRPGCGFIKSPFIFLVCHETGTNSYLCFQWLEIAVNGYVSHPRHHSNAAEINGRCSAIRYCIVLFITVRSVRYCVRNVVLGSWYDNTINRFAFHITGCPTSTGRSKWGSHSYHHCSSAIHRPKCWRHSCHSSRARDGARHAPGTVGP